MTALLRRQAVIDKYAEIIGRNIYSQSLRDYCYKVYKDGKYYSDCSSSICYAYQQAGQGFGITNTAGMYNSTKLTTVDADIAQGIPDTSRLRPGDMLLFAGTVMENIRYGRLDATDEECIAAAKRANAHHFIMLLPDGYQTVIGENGSTLSGGECQRLSIARALLKDAPVILLDEATASLDVDNETEIQNAISRLVKGKTVLIIAHRMRTVESADNIVVLSDGIVAENGTHEELMKENGLYRRLVDLQTASANWKLSV